MIESDGGAQSPAAEPRLVLFDQEAREMGDLYRRAKASVVDSVRYLIDCGRRLQRKKAELEHGQWLTWIVANNDTLGFGERTARKLMAAAEANIPAIKQILGPLLLEESTPEVDRKEATDLVLRTHARAIACRVRRAKAVLSWPWQFTLRSRTGWGSRTEFHKILIEGFGDWMFYGFASIDRDAYNFCRYHIIDLHALRTWVHADPEREYEEIPSPGGNAFVAFDLRRLPEPLLVATSHPVPRGAPPLREPTQRELDLFAAVQKAKD